jgi:hypothetical protein
MSGKVWKPVGAGLNESCHEYANCSLQALNFLHLLQPIVAHISTEQCPQSNAHRAMPTEQCCLKQAATGFFLEVPTS